jgi:Methyltransferase FkbM domain
MALAAEQHDFYRNYPLLSRLEWHLSADRHFAFLMDHVVAKARFHWHNWRRRRLLTPRSLINFEERVFSQNGEDGILREIFRRIGEGDKYSVEFGVEDGSQCCTRVLLMNRQWAGVLLEGSRDYARQAESLYSSNRSVQVGCSFITAENILDLFREFHVPCVPDLLVVDIDGNDYWVLQRILSSYQPRVIVCEYNARWSPDTDWVMPYDASHNWDGTSYYGASLASLFRLGREHGYKLVGCDSKGVNAFFVRADLTGNHFPDENLGLAHYVPPHFGRGFGHPVRNRQGVAFYKRLLGRKEPMRDPGLNRPALPVPTRVSAAENGEGGNYRVPAVLNDATGRP